MVPNGEVLELTAVSVARTTLSVAQLIQIFIGIRPMYFYIARPWSLRCDREVLGDIPIPLPLPRCHLDDHIFWDLVELQRIYDVILPEIETTAGPVDAYPNCSQLARSWLRR